MQLFDFHYFPADILIFDLCFKFTLLLKHYHCFDFGLIAFHWDFYLILNVLHCNPVMSKRPSFNSFHFKDFYIFVLNCFMFFFSTLQII